MRRYSIKEAQKLAALFIRNLRALAPPSWQHVVALMQVKSPICAVSPSPPIRVIIAVPHCRRRNPPSPSPPSSTGQLYSKSASSSIFPTAVAGLIFSTVIIPTVVSSARLLPLPSSFRAPTHSLSLSLHPPSPRRQPSDSAYYGIRSPSLQRLVAGSGISILGRSLSMKSTLMSTIR